MLKKAVGTEPLDSGAVVVIDEAMIDWKSSVAVGFLLEVVLGISLVPKINLTRVLHRLDSPAD